MLKFTYIGHFLTIEIVYKKILDLKNPNGGNMLYGLFYMKKFLVLKNTKISNFGGILKFHLWVDLVRFAAFTVARACPNLS